LAAAAGDHAWLAARALENQHSFENATAVQSEIRCLVRGSRKEVAVVTILRRFSAARTIKGTSLSIRVWPLVTRDVAIEMYPPNSHRTSARISAQSFLLGMVLSALPTLTGIA
jgi:hypothetical protein